MSIAVVVVNWNAGPQITDCVRSLTENGVGMIDEIIVVDNGSMDGSEGSVEGFPGVRLIRLGENIGFGSACNLGTRSVNADFLLFLNPDARIYPGSLDVPLAFMQKTENSDVGICGVALLDEAGHVSRTCARFPSPWSFVFHSMGIDRLWPRLGYFMAEWPHDRTREVDHVIGAFFLVRSSVFRALGGFDERFFVYLEDLDFSFRARGAGWRSMFLAEASAFHAGGGTSRQVKARRLFYSLRSRLVYAAKHFSLVGLVLVALTTLAVEPVSRLAWSMASGGGKAVRETLQAYGMLWRWLPRWMVRGETR